LALLRRETLLRLALLRREAFVRLEALLRLALLRREAFVRLEALLRLAFVRLEASPSNARKPRSRPAESVSN